jgi:hypothetical protein
VSDSGRISNWPKEGERSPLGGRSSVDVEPVAEWQRGETGRQLQLSDGIIGETETR